MHNDSKRLVSLVNALIHGVHWGQVLRQERSEKKGDATLFGTGTLTSAQVKELHDHFKKLATLPTERVIAWSRGGNDAELDGLIAAFLKNPIPSSERLPVNVLIAYMKKRLTGPEEFFVRAVANLVQLCLEIDHDGTYLQDLLRLYIALGVKQLSLPTEDAGQIEAGKELAALSAPAPFDTDAAMYRAVIQKLVWWVQKNSGQRDRFLLAREMLDDPEIKPLLPKLKALPPRRVAWLGHSMMMSLHWSTFGSWCDVAAEVMKLINPGFEFRGFHTGGMVPEYAVKAHLDNVLAYKPNETYILVATRIPQDEAPTEQIVKQLRSIGSAVFIVDDVRPFIPLNPDVIALQKRLCEKYGGTLLDYWARGKKQNYHAWECLDQIHMLTDGHLFYARETLKLWAR
jgi:hypothetical protein